jgi:predicted RecB family nuclease
LDLLADFERGRQGEILRAVELHVAAHRFDQAHRTIDSYELEVRERQLPLETLGIAAQPARALNRVGIETVEQLRAASPEQIDTVAAAGTTLESVARIKAIWQRLQER